MLCTKCGTQNTAGAESCERCGARLAPPLATQPAGVETPPGSAHASKASADSNQSLMSGILYLLAAVAFLMGLAAAIVVITSDSAMFTEDTDASDKALIFLMLFRYGVFATGLIAGLAGLIEFPPGVHSPPLAA